MYKQELYNFLNDKNIQYEVTEHQAVFNMEELSQIDIPYPEADAKNLFVRDDKKKNYYLITVKGDKRVNLKEFRKENQTRPLSFASEDELKEIMHLIPGAVTPLGILNDEERKVKMFLDDYFLKENGLIGVHPNDNTATVWMQAEDLIDIIKEHGNEVEICSIG
ncbi:Ala-tRNA(Pro) deacylase [Fusobacterium sp. PH5-7]|nr:prolyl-tRNA synthetase associated domain-containing protein [Fusobacterium sp. PH5-7]MDH6457972.1 Ala-tRNA(Pro) deacylase [Fusobacterium sp. PH5-7]